MSTNASGGCSTLILPVASNTGILLLAGDDRPQAIRERREIPMNEVEDCRGCDVHVNVRVLCQYLIVSRSRSFPSMLPISISRSSRSPADSVAGSIAQERIERLVQPRGVTWASRLQIIDLGVEIMHANVCRSDRVSLKFVIVKGLYDTLKRLCPGRRGSEENGSRQRHSGSWFFFNIEIELPHHESVELYKSIL